MMRIALFISPKIAAKIESSFGNLKKKLARLTRPRILDLHVHTIRGASGISGGGFSCA
jgi:hypothetical protein